MRNSILVLGSSSKIRQNLLKSFSITPDIVCSPEIDETPYPNELPLTLAKRLAHSKAKAVFDKFMKDDLLLETSNGKNVFILSLDSVIAVGRRILSKSKNIELLEKNLRFLSGRSNVCYTGFCIIVINKVDKGLKTDPKTLIKYCKTSVKFKRMADHEIQLYLQLANESTDKETNYTNAVYQSERITSRFIKSINGSISNLQGLPLCEVINSLESLGFEYH